MDGEIHQGKRSDERMRERSPNMRLSSSRESHGHGKTRTDETMASSPKAHAAIPRDSPSLAELPNSGKSLAHTSEKGMHSSLEVSHSKTSRATPGESGTEKDEADHAVATKKRKNSTPSRLSFSDDLEEEGGAESDGNELSMSRATAQRFKKERSQKKQESYSGSSVFNFSVQQSIQQQSFIATVGITAQPTVADASSMAEHMGTHGASGEWWECVDDCRGRPGRVVDDDDEDNAVWKQKLRVRHGVSAKQGRRPYMEDVHFAMRSVNVCIGVHRCRVLYE